MVSVAQYPADLFQSAGRAHSILSWHTGLDAPAPSCRAGSHLGLGIDTAASEWATRNIEYWTYVDALRLAQACIFTFAQAYERTLKSPTLPALPGQEHDYTSDADPAGLPLHYTNGNARATPQADIQKDQQQGHHSHPYGRDDLFHVDKQNSPKVDLRSVSNVRELKGKKKKNQAAKANAWESDNEEKQDNTAGGDGGGGDNNAGSGEQGAGGSGDGADPNGNGGDAPEDDDNSWNFGGGKKAKKAKKKQNAFSWDALDEDENKNGEDESAPPAEPAAAEADPEDEWAGFTTAKKKKKKGKASEPEPAETKFDDINLDESSAPKLDLDFGGTTETKSSGFGFSSGWGSGWGSSANKWDTSAADDTAKIDEKAAETTLDDTWGSFGKKDKKKKGNAFDFGFDAGGADDNTADAPQEDKPLEDDPWAGFTTSKKKKKKGATAEEPLPSPPEPEVVPEPVLAEPEPEAADDFSWGMSAKDKKKAKKAAKKMGLQSPEPEIIPEPEPEPPAIVEEPTPAEDKAPDEDDPWAGFSTGKKKKKKGKSFDSDPPVMEPEPAPVVEEPPPEPEIVPEPAQPDPEPTDDFSWGMSAKDKKKAKKAKKGLLSDPEPAPVEEPPVPEIVEDPVSEPAPIEDDFSWGMSAKDKKKAKKAAKNSTFMESTPLEDTPVQAEEPKVEETALVVAEPAEADDWFSGWGTGKKKKSKKTTAADILPEAPPPPSIAAEPIEEVKEEENWTFGWGQPKKDKKKKGKSSSPGPPEPDPVAEVKGDVVMVPESVDEPKAEVDDDFGWGVGTKKKKTGKKDIAVEVVEPSPDIPVQKPEEDAWAWTTGKKGKKGKKGSVFDVAPPPVPTPPEPVVENSVPDVVEEPLVDVSEASKPMEEDVWGFTTKKSKKDKKSKHGKSDELELTKTTSSGDNPQDDVAVASPEQPVEPEHEPEPEPQEEESKEDAKKKKKEEKKSSSGGWGLFGSSSKSSSKDKEKERKERKEKEAAEEAQKKLDEEAAFAAALEGEHTDLLGDQVVDEAAKVDTAAGWGFWGASLKPTKKLNAGPGNAAESRTNETSSKDDGLQMMTGVNLADEGKSSSKANLKTGAKGSIADRIKALQENAGKDDKKDDKKSKRKSTDDPAPSLAEEPGKNQNEEPHAQIIPVQESPIQDVSSKKSSSKDKDKKSSKSSKKEKSASPPPEVATLIDPSAGIDIVPATSPIPGGFPEDDVPETVVMPIPEKKSSKDKKSSKATTNTSSSRKDSKLPKPEVSQPPLDDLPRVVDEPTDLPTPSPERKSAKKERPKVVRDQAGSSWGFWGSASKPDPKEERRKERRSKEESTPSKERSSAPGLSRSKSARKPSEKDRTDRADRSSGSDRPKRHDRDRPSTSRGLSFSGAIGMGTPVLSRSKSARHSTSAQKSGRTRESGDRDRGIASPPADDYDPKISAKAAEIMGIGGKRSLGRRDSTREKRKSKGPPDPYAIDDDMVVVDTPEGSADHTSERRRPKPSHRSSKRESAIMSGGLTDDPVLVDAHGPSDEPEVITGPDDLAFVEKNERPALKRSATSAKKTGLFSGLLGSLKQSSQGKSRAYDSDDGFVRHRREVEDDDEGSRRLRREARKVHRSRPNEAEGLTDAGPVLSPTEEDDVERRRAERRARRAERNAAETAETDQRDSRRREKELTREEDRKTRRIRDEEDAEARRQEEKRARRAARRQEEEQEAKDEERRAKRREKERTREKAEEEERRTRREERRLRHDKERSRPSRHRSDFPAPVDDYFDSRNGTHGAYGDRVATAPATDNRPYLPGAAPDKTSSWVNSVNEDPPPPPPVEGTIVDAPVHFATPALDEDEALAAETTARELRRKQRRERERNGEVNSSDERRRRRRDDRKAARDEDVSRDGSGGDKSRRTSKAYNSLGYPDMAKTFDGRPAGTASGGKGWLKKIAGLG